MIPDRQKLHVFYVAFSDNEINNFRAVWKLN